MAKKFTQSSLVNFFQNSKIHVSSEVKRSESPSTFEENDENKPFDDASSLSALKSPKTDTPSVLNFMKAPALPASQPQSKKRKLSADTSPLTNNGKALKTPKITETVECDPEVSSSSEAVESHFAEKEPLESSTTKTPLRATLDGFVRTTQQAEVSTTASTEENSDERSETKDLELTDDHSSESPSEEAEGDREASPLRSADDKNEVMEIESAEEKLQPTATPVTPKAVISRPKTLTPKQRVKEEEKQKKQEERDRLKKEKEAEKERIKAEKLKEKEEKLKAKQQEKERLEKEKEEARIKKEEERKRKLEEQEAEKLKKEEERRKKEEEKLEEKRRKEEEKRLQDEEKHKKEQEKLMLKEKQAKALASFLTKKDKPLKSENVESPRSQFGIPFQVREHMVLAPLYRKDPVDVNRDCLDQVINSGETLSPSKLYTGNWREVRATKKPSKGRATCLPGTEYKEAQSAHQALKGFDSSNPTAIHCKAKFLRFHENNRPAYFGTFRKKSKMISARNPLKMDEDMVDYEVDSDDEWEEEEPGEDLEKQSDGEGDDEEEVEEQEEDPFFVPHGYLSDGEGAESAAESDDEDDENDHDNDKLSEHKKKVKKEKAKIPENKLDPAARKAEQEVKAKAFEVERKTRKITRLIPRCIGVLWSSLGVEGSIEEQSFDKNVAKTLNIGLQELNQLTSYRAIVIPPAQFPVATQLSNPPKTPQSKTAEESNQSQSSVNQKRSQRQAVPEEAFPDLLRLVHGSSIGINKMIKEFKKFWKMKPSLTSEKLYALSENKDAEATPVTPGSDQNDISNRQLELTIKNIAEYNNGMWLVNEEIQKKYDLLEKLPVPHQWDFQTLPAEVAKGPEVSAIKTPQRTLLNYFNKASSPSVAGSSSETTQGVDNMSAKAEFLPADAVESKLDEPLATEIRNS